MCTCAATYVNMVTLQGQLSAKTCIVCEFIARLYPLISLNYSEDVTLESNVMSEA